MEDQEANGRRTRTEALGGGVTAQVTQVQDSGGTCPALHQCASQDQQQG